MTCCAVPSEHVKQQDIGWSIACYSWMLCCCVMTFLLLCSEQILEQKKRALQAKEALEQEHLRNVETDKQAREAERNQAKAKRIAEAQRAQQRAALDLQQKTNYFQVNPLHASILCTQPLISINPSGC